MTNLLNSTFKTTGHSVPDFICLIMEKGKPAGTTGSNFSSNENPGSNNSGVQNFVLPQISLPKGGGAIKKIEEKFQVNAVNGTSTFNIPLPVSPSRNGSSPSVGLSYSSGNGNSAFGLGWQLSIPSISRKTEKGIPQYKDEEESDTFLLSGAEDLVPLLEQQPDGSYKRYRKPVSENGINYIVKRYRPRIEGSFVRIEKWQHADTGETHWRTISPSNAHTIYGLTTESRISDPADDMKVYEWLICRSFDDKGNIILYNYKKEDFAGINKKLNENNRIGKCTQLYLKKVNYGNKKAWYLNDPIPAEKDFMFSLVFDYGEHDAALHIPLDIDKEKQTWACRKDPFSNCRPGFELRTWRRCSRVMCFHSFDELPHSPYLTSSLQLIYDDEINPVIDPAPLNGFSLLTQARQNGHMWDSVNNHYTTQSLPELEINYQLHEWNPEIKTVAPGDLVHAPAGLSDKRNLWVDLFNEGLSGILTGNEECLYYKHNHGGGKFSQAKPLASMPSLNMPDGNIPLQEIEGNGIKYLVQHEREPKGFYKLNEDNEWEPFTPFPAFPNIDPGNPGVRYIDLSGDGTADILYTGQDTMECYFSAGEKGFTISQSVCKEIDEEKGPAIVFSDKEQCIFFADMNGDGLTDIVRIRNGEICYWPNRGYGEFGGKVNMDNAPQMDHLTGFNPAMLRLADIDGSGTTDIIYLGKNDFRTWINLNGNEWSAGPRILPAFPRIDSLSDVLVLDFLGTGTACIVHSSPIGMQPMQYIDLMGSKKPHLFCGYRNNCGLEVGIDYKPSTYFYLKDQLEGNPWITRLPFPVHCIWKVRSEDKIRQTVFTSTYAYRHGYYDFIEGEFRGFARVEQLDTEEFDQFKLNEAKNVVEEVLHQPPVRTVSWYHTGAFLRNKKILHQCEEEYFKNTLFNEHSLSEPEITGDLSADELREANRACKGLALRSEVFANDQSDKQAFPYTTSNSTYEIRRVQPKDINQYASFMIVPRESISYGYDRIPGDPRITHAFVLDTDELGSIKKTATVVYPRVKRPVAPNAVPDKVWNTQNKMSISYGEVNFTNDILQDNVYRLRAAYESKSFELAGLSQPPGFYFMRNEMANEIAAATQILFEVEFDGSRQKRLTAHTRDYFYKDDLTGPLALGVLSALAIPHKSYQLAFTKDLVTKYYGNKLSNQALTDAKYVHSEGDEHWWTQSGDILFPADPKKAFYTPIGGKDVFGNESLVEYDPYFFLPVKTIDAIGNFSTAVNDYRILSPVLITDPNLNRSAVETDVLGMVTRSAGLGKSGANEGDTLTDPGSRLEYDLFNWKNNGKPNYAHTFVRERHGATNPRWQESYSYFDGDGGAIMTKVQVNPGKARRWNTQTKQVEEIGTNDRWLGNGRTIVNNKGNVVKSYESYFSTTSDYESEDALVETGVTSISFYDAVSRNIRTEHSNGTITRVEFDSWRSKSFDVNDTVKESQWFADRGSPDPLSTEPANPETRAAWLAAKHANTPGIVHADVLGRIIYSEEDYGGGNITTVFSETDFTSRALKVYDQLNRLVSETYVNLSGQIIYAKSAEQGERWFFADIMGRMVRVWDNNIREMYGSFDKLHRPVSSFLFEGGNEILYSHIVYGDSLPDAVARQSNLKGSVYQVFDQAGLMTINNVDFKGNVLNAERTLCKEYKQMVNWVGLSGVQDPDTIMTIAGPLLSAETFTTSGQYDALNRPITMTLPDNSVYEPTYNEANFLASLKIKIRGQGDFVTFFEGQDYDARGQRQFAKYGNGTITKYFYDPKTFNLTNLITKLAEADADSQSIQNLRYTYDPTGNIVQIRDDAQQTHFFNNAVVFPENKFEFDAGYRLKKATGREHAGLGGNNQRNDLDLPFIQQLPHENDSQAVRNYTELYEYDECGNIKRLQHIATNANWTQRYQYNYEADPTDNTNRLKATSAPGDSEGVFSASYSHDAYGNMTSMPHLPAANSLKWNFMQQLKEVNLDGGGKVYYVYGSDGKRIRKIIERPGGRKLERIYLGPVEIYRESDSGNAPDLERYTLHVSDNAGRIAQVDTKTIDTNNRDPLNFLNTSNIRYQYGNHLGSATLETDANGVIISYEEYHPYGTSSYRVAKPDTDLSLKRHRYCGKERDDETGFYYCGARYYAAWLCRWISSDPAGFADGLNLFHYCGNNPIVFIDPDGTEKVTIVKKQHFTGQESLDDLKKEIPQGYKLKPGVDADNYKQSYIPGKGKDGAGGVWNLVVPDEQEPKEESDSESDKAAATVAAGSQVIRNNPTGATIAVEDTIDKKKLNRLKEGVRRREVGRNAGPGNSTRTRRNSPVQRNARTQFQQRVQPRTPTPSGGGQWNMGHRIDLQYDLTGRVGNSWRDYVWEPGGPNQADGRQGWQRLRQHPQGVPAGGVAKAGQAGRFWNTPGFRTAGRWGGGALLGGGTIFSGAFFYRDVQEGNWFGAALSGTGTAAGLLEIGGWVAKSSRLVTAGRFLGAPGAVISSGMIGWEFGTFINENSGIQNTAQSSGEWAQKNLWNNVYFGATVAAGTAIVTSPYYAGQAIGNRTYDYFTTDKYTLVPWRAAWWPF